MVGPITRDRVDAFWSSTLGVDLAQLHDAGVHVRENPPGRDDWGGAYVLTFDDAVWVFVPADLLDLVTTVLAGRDAAALLEPALWQELLGERVRLAFGPVVHHYLDHDATLAGLATGRRINPRDAASLAELRAAIPPEEWLAAGFAAQAAMLFGIFEDERMVAAANLTAGPDAATDVGIIIHPDARGRGHAVRVAATAAAQALRMHGVARFRALATSPPTMAIATKLGFQEYGRNLALYLS